MDASKRRKKIIEEICLEKGIEKIDLSYDWISILKKGKKEQKLIDGNFYLNSSISAKLAKDKYSTYELLKYYGIPIVKHEVLFNETIIPHCEKINCDYQCLKNEDKQVIKANNSSEGRDVYMSDDEIKKRQIVNQIFENGIEAVVVCPYKEIEYEYRAIFLYGEIIYIYKKQKPFIVGDGKRTVKELIEEKVKYLAEPMEELKLECVLKKGEKRVVGWKHNLSNGAIPLVINQEDIYYDRVEKLALQTGKVMDLNFASVDVMVTKQEEILVMEVNSNVMLNKFCELVPNGYEIGKDIYTKVVDKIFEK